jgi:hypothetical protein
MGRRWGRAECAVLSKDLHAGFRVMRAPILVLDRMMGIYKLSIRI